MSGRLVNQRKRYTELDKREACALHVVLGNIEAVARDLDIPATTVQSWKKEAWWEEQQKELRAEKEDEMVAQLAEVIDEAHRQTIDRLKNGDHHVIKTKEGHVVERVPMKGKDAATVGAIAVDKQRILLNKPTSISASQGTNEDMIKNFAKLVSQHDREERIVSEQ